MLVETDGVGRERAEIAAHREMEIGVIPLDRRKQAVDHDFGGEFLADFPHKRLLGRLAGFDFPARELPPVLPGAIAPLGGKEFVSPADDGGYDVLDRKHTREN